MLKIVVKKIKAIQLNALQIPKQNVPGLRVRLKEEAIIIITKAIQNLASQLRNKVKKLLQTVLRKPCFFFSYLLRLWFLTVPLPALGAVKKSLDWLRLDR